MELWELGGGVADWLGGGVADCLFNLGQQGAASSVVDVNEYSEKRASAYPPIHLTAVDLSIGKKRPRRHNFFFFVDCQRKSTGSYLLREVRSAPSCIGTKQARNKEAP